MSEAYQMKMYPGALRLKTCEYCAVAFNQHNFLDWVRRAHVTASLAECPNCKRFYVIQDEEDVGRRADGSCLMKSVYTFTPKVQ